MPLPVVPDSVHQHLSLGSCRIICTPSLFVYDGNPQKGKEALLFRPPPVSCVFQHSETPVSFHTPQVFQGQSHCSSSSKDLCRFPSQKTLTAIPPVSAPFHSDSDGLISSAANEHFPFHTDNHQVHTAPPLHLIVTSYNLGGPSITKERFGHTLLALAQSFPTLPKIISLGEFKPTGAPLHEFQWLAKVGTSGQYQLLSSTDPDGINGVAFLIHQDLTPNGCPEITVHHAARVISFEAKIHSDPNIPPVRFVGIYGSSLARDRILLQQTLTPLLSDWSIIFGDFNAITRIDDATDVSLHYGERLIWPWLRNLEDAGNVIDLMRFAYQDTPPKDPLSGTPRENTA